MNDREHPSVVMYSTTWCGDCRRSKSLLDRTGVPYEEINIDNDPEAAATVQQLNRGYRSVPTIVIGGTTVLTEPSDRQLMAALDLARATMPQ
jgi:mycoredoxin